MAKVGKRLPAAQCVKALPLLITLYRALKDAESIERTVKLLSKYKCTAPATKQLEKLIKVVDKTEHVVNFYLKRTARLLVNSGLLSQGQLDELISLVQRSKFSEAKDLVKELIHEVSTKLKKRQQ